MKTKVLLVDDHPLFRKGLRLLLEEEKDLQVVGEAGDGQTAIDLVRKLIPDVVVMDITMPNLNGIEATRHIISESPNTKVMALSIHSGKRFVEDMLRAGAAGYLLKESAPEELVNGIRAVVRGEVCLSAAIAGVVVSQYVNVLSQADTSAGKAELTTREIDVARLLAEGSSTKEIAPVLQVSTKTVESVRLRIMKKLDVKNVAELTEIAKERHWLKGDSRAVADGPTDHPILGTKLHRPPVPPDLVPRSQILEGLTNLDKRSLTLISASAGYGKSTLVSSWLETCACPYTWLSLDEDDNDLRVFLRYFLAAIQKMFPDAGQNIQTLLNAPNLPPLSVLAETLLNDLDQIDDPFILVLDDYHCIHETAVHDLLTELLRHPPKGMHLALLTRRDPPLPLVTLRGLGQMNEISSSQLRFSPAETAAFMENALELSVDEATATVIDEKIEGWPAGLRLMVHSLANRRDLNGFLAGLQGDFSSTMEYLVAEVLTKQPSAVANFLLRTAILDRFCAPLCDVLCDPDVKSGKGQVDGKEFIDWLQTNNLFLISLDVENRWFRYHYLFQQLLQNQLESRYSSEEIATLHSRAGAWFGENGLIEEAIRHALAAGDVIRAAQLVEQNRISVLNDDKWYVLKKWLSMLPDVIKQEQPELLMARACVLYEHLDILAISPIIDVVETLLKDEPIEQPLRGEIEFFKGFISLFQGDSIQSLKHLEVALERIPITHYPLRGDAEVIFGLACHMLYGKEKASHQLNEWIYSEPSPQDLRMTRLLASLIYIHLISGDLAEAYRLNQQLQAVATRMKSVYAITYSSYFQGIFHFFHNELDTTLTHFSVVAKQRHILTTRTSMDALAGLALTYQARQQPDKARTVLDMLFDYAHSQNDPTGPMIARSCQARLWLMQGDLDAAVRWLKANDPPPDAIMLWWIEIPAITRCRALLAEGSDVGLKEAEKRLQEYLQLNQANHNTRQMIEISALLAMIYQRQEKKNKALSVLKRAITMAQPGGFIRPFIELGSPMVDLLRQLAKQHKSIGFVRQLLVAFRHEPVGAFQDTSDSTAAHKPPMGSEALLDPLSKRELEVLSLLAQGLSNKEIASKIFLSSETIKKHVYNIYQKLDVHSRISAIAKAKELGILPRN